MEERIPLDETLLVQITKGDADAFSQLVRRHGEQYFRLAWHITHNRQDAEDIIQECFLMIWKNPGCWDAHMNTRFTSWFYQVVVNRALNVCRKRRQHDHEALAYIVDTTPVAEEQIAIIQRKTSFDHAIRELPPQQRTALNLCFYDGMSNKEAANSMGISLRALQSLLIRAKQNLRKKLTETKSGVPTSKTGKSRQ